MNETNTKLAEQDYQLLSQYVDGELPATDTLELERRLAGEPALRAALRDMRSLNRQLRESIDAVTPQELPRRVTGLLEPQSNVVALPRRRLAGWTYALAASLAVAVCGTLLTQWGGESGSGLDSRLAESLETLPSSGSSWTTLADGRQVRAVLTFPSSSGRWCREYLLSGSQGDWHGVACRHENGWVDTVREETALVVGPGEYRPASADAPASVEAFIDGNAAGIALDAGQEAALIDKGWQ